MPTRLTRQFETAKICNKFAGFRLWWVGGGLEFSQPASGGLDRNVGIYLPNLIYAHTYL